MKLASDDETLAENKVLILYVLEKANKALTNDVLYKIVLESVNMNYFYFQQFTLDLINVGYIYTFQKENYDRVNEKLKTEGCSGQGA